jgi:hypothetical protein
MTIHFLPPELDRYDVAVEDAIATCNGDLRGALKAVLILNEHLEAQLGSGIAGRDGNGRDLGEPH